MAMKTMPPTKNNMAAIRPLNLIEEHMVLNWSAMFTLFGSIFNHHIPIVWALKKLPPNPGQQVGDECEGHAIGYDPEEELVRHCEAEQPVAVEHWEREEVDGAYEEVQH